MDPTSTRGVPGKDHPQPALDSFRLQTEAAG